MPIFSVQPEPIFSATCANFQCNLCLFLVLFSVRPLSISSEPTGWRGLQHPDPDQAADLQQAREHQRPAALQAHQPRQPPPPQPPPRQLPDSLG